MYVIYKKPSIEPFIFTSYVDLRILGRFLIILNSHIIRTLNIKLLTHTHTHMYHLYVYKELNVTPIQVLLSSSQLL